jgi:hypothetical protein
MKPTSDCLIHPSTPDGWIALQADSLARIFQPLEKEQELPEIGLDSGQNLPASFGWYDPDSHLLKTAQCSLFEDSMLSSLTLPRSGSMRNGKLYPRPKWEPRIFAKGYGLWPTPVAEDTGRTPEAHMAMKQQMPGGPRYKPTSLTVMVNGIERGLWPTPCARDHFPPHNPEYIAAKKAEGHGMSNLNDAVSQFPTPTKRDHKGGANWSNRQRQGKPRPESDMTLCDVVEKAGGSLNPTWVEWLMGWPLNHTRRIGGDKSQKASRVSHKV